MVFDYIYLHSSEGYYELKLGGKTGPARWDDLIHRKSMIPIVKMHTLHFAFEAALEAH